MVISCLQEYELEADARRKPLGMLQRRYVEPTKDILAMQSRYHAFGSTREQLPKWS